MRRQLITTYRVARRVVVGVVGFTVVGVGLAMAVLPGPAVVVIPLGLAILGLEFAWARRWLAKFKNGGHAVLRRLSRRPDSSEQNPRRASRGGSPGEEQ